MSVTELKQVLHSRIEEINDQALLEEVLSLVDTPASTDHLSEKEIAILEDRNARYLKGEEKEIPIEEFNARISKQYGF